MGNCLNCLKFLKSYKNIDDSQDFDTTNFQERFIQNDGEGILSTTNMNISHTDQYLNNKNNKKISLDNFEEIKLLGRGTFGKVLLVKKKDNNKFYAMKVLKKKLIKIKNQEDHTKTERQILEKIEHPFIVNLHYAFQDAKKLFLVTEFCQGGELFFHLRKVGVLKENDARFYLCEIVSALEHLHKNNCIYRDLKPENILIDNEGHIKLTDFGLSKLILSKKDERAYTICGTPEYLAPEIIVEKGYDKSVDWWSMGALFYEMLTGSSPFKSNNGNKQLDLKIYTKKIKMYPYFSNEAKSLLNGLITINPKQRLGSGPNGSENIKAHPFFKNINWTNVILKKLNPPYKPQINIDANVIDLSHFDPMFTKENIFEPNSEIREKNIGGDSNNIGNSEDIIDKSIPSNNNYEGFTYIKTNTLSSLMEN